ncbi:MAG: IS21 family transposase [Magnetococcales bacterium]|nr:IS21 family transposase [Magnetococcales bacterium]
MVKLGEIFMIIELHREGLSISAISRQTGFDRKTVRNTIRRGVEPPKYGPRPHRPTLLEPFQGYLAERVRAVPELNGTRLFREIRELGYQGGYTAVKDFLRAVRPPATTGFELRFETPPGRQGQADFSFFRTTFEDEPGVERIVWLFSLVLGHSRFMWGRFVLHQDLQTVLRCHQEAFEALGGVPATILYDRMKTVVQDENENEGIAYNKTMLAFSAHYGFLPKACRPYRAKTKGKVERPFRYVREDFFLGRSFRNLGDLNAQFRKWLDEVANQRLHSTTRRVVQEHFAEERAHLGSLPAGPFRDVLKFDRRISKDGMVSIGGNFYSVPNSTTRRVVDVQSLADEIRIFENGQLIATHPILEGRGQRRIAAGHRSLTAPVNSPTMMESSKPPPDYRPGHSVQQRPLAVYAAVGKRIAEART